MVSENTLNAIRERVDLVDVVGDYVRLKKSGRGLAGLCPFHKEKTPSFRVDPDRQLFHCFGCHKGGNVFTFLMEIEGYPFPQAVEKLAQRVGITLEQETTRKRAAPRPTHPERIQEALNWAAKYFHYLLLERPEYQFARDYIASRGIETDTVRRFQIGVSPIGWRDLLTKMSARKFSVDELVEAGLVKRREDAKTVSVYDAFRQRLMFPIRDKEGNTLGFGARVLVEDDKLPKYLNSAESPAFQKRRTLYGVFENQREIRLQGEALMVEGYMDVVGLAQAGVGNAVAVLGTALTEEHCYFLRSLTKKVVTVFDPDPAGIEAWKRSVSLFLGSGIFAKDLRLPTGKDPDEYVKEVGAEVFFRLCEEAPRQITKRLKEIASEGAMSEERRAKHLEELTPILVASLKLPDRAVLWDDIALVLNVSPQVLRALVQKARGETPAQKPETTHGTPPAKAAKPVEAENLPHPLEIEFFKACLAAPSHLEKTPAEEWQGWIEHPMLLEGLRKFAGANRQAFDTWCATRSESWFGSCLEPLFDPAPKEARAQFDAIQERLKQRKRESEIKKISVQIRLSQRLGPEDGNDEEQVRLLEKLRELRSQNPPAEGGA